MSGDDRVLDALADLAKRWDRKSATYGGTVADNVSRSIYLRCAEELTQVGLALLSESDAPSPAVPDEPVEAVGAEKLASNLRAAIKASGLTQQEVAERVDMDPTALSKALSGTRSISSLELALICTATGSDVLGILEADPIHGPSYRRGLAQGSHWAGRDLPEDFTACGQQREGQFCDLPAEHWGPHHADTFWEAVTPTPPVVEPERATPCNRCGVAGKHYDWCERAGFTARDVRLCPGDGCQGCFHCTSTEGDEDADVSAERGRVLESSRAAGLDGGAQLVPEGDPLAPGDRALQRPRGSQDASAQSLAAPPPVVESPDEEARLVIVDALAAHTYVIDGPPAVIGVRCACGFRDYPEFMTPEAADLSARAHVASVIAAQVAEGERRAKAEVADAFVAWSAKNEIAAPPLDWAWFGEIACRYSPLHERHEDETR